MNSGEIVNASITFKKEDESKEYKIYVATENFIQDIVKFDVRPLQPGNYMLSLFIAAAGA